MSDIIKAELAKRGHKLGDAWELPCSVVVRMERRDITIKAPENCTDLEGELVNIVIAARIREWRDYHEYIPDEEERAFAREFDALYDEQPKSQSELDLERIRRMQGENGYD